MFDLPNPVGMYEQAKMAGLERDVAEEFLSTAYSGYLALMWGLRKLPFIGDALGAHALAIYASLKSSKLFNEGRLRITAKKDMLDPNQLANFQTEWKESK